MNELFSPRLVDNAITATDLERPCEHCHRPFKPREKSGGKAQRFCTPECRFSFHAQRGQRGGPHVGADDDAASEAAPSPNAALEAPQVKGSDSVWDNDEIVVFREQKLTAAYFNPDGDLVIRQLRDWNEDDDPCVIISANNIQTLIDRLCDLMGIGSAGRLNSRS
jgi:hypothetical protein